MPLIETPAGVLATRSLAEVDAVVRLALGNVDLAASLGVLPTSQPALAMARSTLVLASAAAGIAAPIDGVTTSIGDHQALRDDLARGVDLGLTAKLCIHPAQVAIVHEEFQPDAEEVEWARRVLELPDDGVTTLGTEMIDRPVRLRAETILLRAGDGR